MNRSAHPSEEEFERFAIDELTAVERGAFLDHATACVECAPILRAVLDLRRSDRRAVVPFGGPRRRKAWLLAASAGLAAALALMIGRPFGPGREADRTLRAGAESRLVGIEPRGTLAAAPAVVRWEAWKDAVEGAGAVEYRLTVLRDDGSAVAERILPAGSDPRLDWPEEARAPGRYVWSVEALRDGERLARSPLIDVRW